MAIFSVTDMARIAPLYAPWPEYMPRATLDGCMGEAWANAAGTAAQVFVGGFSFLAGDAACPEAGELAANLPQRHAGGEYFIASHEPEWEPVVERALGARAVRGLRYAIRKDTDRFDPAKLAQLAQTLPESYTLAAMDEGLYRMAMAHEWSRDLVSQFADEADYLRRGVGMAVLHGGQLVAGASSYVVFRGGIEIEIDTRRDHRRRGLATACGAALVHTCLARGLYPSWDAYSKASVALAEKLGYVAGEPYVTYTVNGKAKQARDANEANP